MEKALTLENLSMPRQSRLGRYSDRSGREITAERILSPQAVKLPGVLVDCVVVAKPEPHETFREAYNPAYTGEIKVSSRTIAPIPERTQTIARRAAMFLKINAVVNLGIGVLEGVASVARRRGTYSTSSRSPSGLAASVASRPGVFSFGAVAAQAIIDQPYQFYDGGGRHQAFLGMAEVDGEVTSTSAGSGRGSPGLAGS